MKKTTSHSSPEELIVFAQEYGDSKRAQALYDLDSDDEEEEKIDPNPKLVQGGIYISDDHDCNVYILQETSCREDTESFPWRWPTLP